MKDISYKKLTTAIDESFWLRLGWVFSGWDALGERGHTHQHQKKLMVLLCLLLREDMRSCSGDSKLEFHGLGWLLGLRSKGFSTLKNDRARLQINPGC